MGASIEKKSKRGTEERDDLFWLCLSVNWAMRGCERTETSIRLCPRLSVATQNLLKFGRGLGRAGSHEPSVLHLGPRVGTAVLRPRARDALTRRVRTAP